MVANKGPFGLGFSSDLDLPEIGAATESAVADVLIRQGRLADAAKAQLRQVGPLAFVGPDCFLQSIPDIGDFAVIGGCEIRVDPCPGVGIDVLRPFLLGTPLGVLLLQRGLLVMHGNAVAIDGRVVVCVGDSGAGKSTLAKALLDRGHAVLADDLTVISDDLQAVPGVPRIKLWQDSADQLGVATPGLARVRPNLDKFCLPLERPGLSGPMAVDAIIELKPTTGEGISIIPREGLHAFNVLRQNVFRSRFVNALGLWPRLMPKIARLQEAAKIVRIERSVKGFDLDGLIAATLQIRAVGDGR